MIIIIGTWDWQTTFKSDGKADERSSIYLIYIYICLVFTNVLSFPLKWFIKKIFNVHIYSSISNSVDVYIALCVCVFDELCLKEK